MSPSSHRPQVGNLSRTIEKINGVARCPYDPRHNSTAVISSQGELYAATVIDFSGRDPAIYRSLGNGPPLRTAQYNSKWLNGKAAQGAVPSLLPNSSARAHTCFIKGEAQDRAGVCPKTRAYWRWVPDEVTDVQGTRIDGGQAIREERI